MYIFLFLFSLLLSVVIALQFPSVQTKLVQKATEYISEKLKYPISIGAIDIHWFDTVNLKRLSIKDTKGNEMIYLGNALIDFDLSSLLNPSPTIDEVTLKDGRVKLYKFKPDGSLNMDEFIIAIQNATESSEKTEGPPKPFVVEKVKLKNMYFSYFDERQELIKKGFDHYHFEFTDINADVSNLRIIADTFQIKVNSLSTLEKQTKLKVNEMSVDYMLSKNTMIFDNISANIGNSYLDRYLKFEYKKITDLADFNEKIVVTATLDSSRIYSKDLANFAPILEPYNDYARLSGNFQGKVINFRAKNLNLGFGKNSLIRGRASFKGLPEIDETYIDFKFTNSRVASNDLKQYFPKSSYDVISKFGNINATGEFVGFPYDFVAHGKFATGLGKLDSDLHFSILENTRPKSKYSGSLITYEFQLGNFLGIPEKVGKIDMSGKIEGKGLSLNEAEVKLDAKISRLEANGYAYKKIVTNATLSNELFDGSISVDDPNLVFTANGLINLKDDLNKFDINANFQKANLKPLNLADRETFLVSNMELNFTGLELDDIVGNATFTKTYLLYENNKEIFIDSLFAESTKDGKIRNLHVDSDLLAIDAEGNFEFTSLYQDVTRLYKEYKLNFQNDQTAIAAYYNKKRKEKSIDKYRVDYDIKIKNLNKIFSVYVPGLYLSENTLLKGEFINGQTSILNSYTHFDTLYYKENEAYNIDIELSTSKLADSSNVLAMGYINSPAQALKGLPKTENFFFEGIWNQGEIDFSTRIKQQSSSNYIQLNGLLSLFRNKQQILELRNSYFNLLNKRWDVSNDNKIYFTDQGIIFNNLMVGNENQFIDLNGIISENPEKEAVLNINNFSLATISPLIPETKVRGIVNANLTMKGVLKDLNIGGTLNVDSLTVDNFLIGHIRGRSDWDNSLNNLNVAIDVIRDEAKVIELGGFIKNREDNSQELHLNANLDKARLEILNPVLKGIMSDIGGTASGHFKIEGTTKDISVIGRAYVDQGRFKIDYLNTTYTFNDYIYLDENLIGFKKLRLKDHYGDFAVIKGGIYHDSFRDYILDIRGFMEHFQVLNTEEKDNELFYGNAFVTGDFEILGAVSDFEIKANAKSNKGTKIYIPITSASGQLEQQSFIRFKSSKNPAANKEENKDTVDLSGIKMEFNFEITPDAYAEIIFDKRAGDIIRGNGSGNLRLEIDTRGDFNLFGNYNIVKGAYNFTLANLINKEFIIEPNSSISWYGDPYQGELKIDAVYNQPASLKPLIIGLDSALASQEGLRKYPVEVLLGLTGPLMTPDINLGINIKNYSAQAASYVTQFESTIQNNEQELNRQVFSLLILGGFTSPNSFSGINASSTSNLSELLTNQLGNWLSQVDENLQIDMDLRGLDKEALNTFNLRMSYSLLDGRLRISRDGRFNNTSTAGTNPAASNQNNISGLAGEWTIEYLLSPDGRLRLKLFNKYSQNQIISNANGTVNPTAGFSLLHTESFNNLKDLFNNKEEKEKKTPIENPIDTSKRSQDTIFNFNKREEEEQTNSGG